MFGFKLQSRSNIVEAGRGRMTKNTTSRKALKKVSKKVSKKVKKKVTKKVSKTAKTKSVSKPIVCGSIKNRNACLRLNRKCKYSTKTKRCQRR